MTAEPLLPLFCPVIFPSMLPSLLTNSLDFIFGFGSISTFSPVTGSIFELQELKMKVIIKNKILLFINSLISIKNCNAHCLKLNIPLNKR
jgi:hypothetical protein